MSNSSIWSLYRTLSGATTLSQSEPGSNSNGGVLHIPQSSSIAGASPSDSLMSYPRHSLVVGAYPYAKIQSVYSTASAGWALILYLAYNCQSTWPANALMLSQNEREGDGSQNQSVSPLGFIKFIIIDLFSLKLFSVLQLTLKLNSIQNLKYGPFFFGWLPTSSVGCGILKFAVIIRETKVCFDSYDLHKFYYIPLYLLCFQLTMVCSSKIT